MFNAFLVGKDVSSRLSVDFPTSQIHTHRLMKIARARVCVCVLSVSHYVRALSAISHCFVNKRIQHFLLLISLSEQMMPEIFILFLMEFQWPLLQIKWKFLHIKWGKIKC